MMPLAISPFTIVNIDRTSAVPEIASRFDNYSADGQLHNMREQRTLIFKVTWDRNFLGNSANGGTPGREGLPPLLPIFDSAGVQSTASGVGAGTSGGRGHRFVAGMKRCVSRSASEVPAANRERNKLSFFGTHFIFRCLGLSGT